LPPFGGRASLDLFAEEEEEMKRFHFIHIKDVITALSLSNLCFLAAWRSALYSSDPKGYNLTDHAMWRNSVGLMLDVLLLATLFWAAYAFARRRGQERLLSLARWVFLFVAFAALDGARRQFYGPLTAPAFMAVVGKTAFIALLVGVFSLVVFTLSRHSRRVISVAQAVILILSPFALMTFSQAVWSIVKNRPVNAAAKNKPAADAGNNTRPANRVLWVIFDELDYQAAFAARPSSVELPELDRLRDESIAATNAYPPAKWTMLSIPALVTGRLVAESQPLSCNELMIKFDGAGEPVGWSTQPNVFSRVREIGGSAAVVGWYHPYCRVIGGDLTRCSFTVVGNEMDTRGQRVSRSMLEHFRMVGAAAQVIRQVLPKSLKSDKRLEFDYVESLKRIAHESAAAATDGALSLAMVHFPAPHWPCLYDRRKNDFTFEGGCNYFDNLELVDRTFGDLRRSMERAGLWDDTVVLVSSDHWWRTDIWPKNQSWRKEEQAVMSKGADYRVPFLLKLKRQRASVIYQPSFNTVLSQDLLLALLRGELSAAPDVTAWLDRHRSIGKSPY
jgi:sulfatase-like protein